MFNDLIVSIDALFASNQGAYPLVHLNLKSIHEASFSDLISIISLAMSDLYANYDELSGSDALSEKKIKATTIPSLKGKKIP